MTELPIFDSTNLIPKTHSLTPKVDGLAPIVTLGETIADLPELEAGDERIVQDYDLHMRERYLEKYSGRFLSDVLNVNNADKLTWHCSRPHSERDLRDFARLREGENCSRALARGVEMEFPYDRNTFKDRYTKQDRNSLCSTIVAHLKSDGLMFIHPNQNRSLTPREAARVQTFPDTFNFSGSRSHVFTQIGNAVPPLVGKKVGLGILKYFSQAETNENRIELGEDEKQKIILELEQFINECMVRPIEFVADDSFKQTWKKIHLLLPHLHPESAMDNGKEISAIPKRSISFCFEPYFLRSGWPVELAPIAQEAKKRLKSGHLASADYFHV